jgi:hypothetical protein
MAEEIYESTGEPGVVRLVESRDWGRGESTIADGPTIHRVCNNSDEDLVTIHLYSPPLPNPPNTFEVSGA